MKVDFNAVVVGVSAGGFQALHTILPMLPGAFPAPVIVVQHRMAGEDDYFVESLNSKSLVTVKEAEEKEEIRPGTAYIAPGGYHLLIEKDHTFSLSVDEPVCYARPSIDVLFETAARVYGSHLVGIILTGANSDGSNGIKTIKRGKGLTIAQDPETAEVNLMPLSAIATHCVDFILPLEDIPSFLTNLVEDNHGNF
jgi:two-component system chemotaxis response regulator CheB